VFSRGNKSQRAILLIERVARGTVESLVPLSGELITRTESADLALVAGIANLIRGTATAFESTEVVAL